MDTGAKAAASIGSQECKARCSQGTDCQGQGTRPPMRYAGPLFALIFLLPPSIMQAQKTIPPKPQAKLEGETSAKREVPLPPKNPLRGGETVIARQAMPLPTPKSMPMVAPKPTPTPAPAPMPALKIPAQAIAKAQRLNQ